MGRELYLIFEIVRTRLSGGYTMIYGANHSDSTVIYVYKKHTH